MALLQAMNTAVAELKANPRLRWGMWLIIGILWFYGILLLREAAENEAEAYLATSKKIAHIQGMDTQTDWPARLEAAQALRLSLESRLWREGTIGLAQASFQDWLSQAVQQATLPNAVVLKVAAQEETQGRSDSEASFGTYDPALPAALWKVSAKLFFDFNPDSFYPFLDRLATHEKWIFVESLVIRGEPIPKVEINLVAYFQKPQPLNDKSPREAQ